MLKQVMRLQPIRTVGPWFSIGGLVQVFWRPGVLFDGLKAAPKVLVPYACFCCLVLISALLVVRFETLAELELLHARGVDTSLMPTEVLIKLLFIQKSLEILSPLVIFLVGRVLLWLLDMKVPARQLLSVILYGEVVYAAGTALTSALILVSNNAYASFSLAPLLSSDVAGNGYQLVSKFDLFLIWEMAVVGTGLNRIFGDADNTSYKLSLLMIGTPAVLQVLMF